MWNTLKRKFFKLWYWIAPKKEKFVIKLYYSIDEMPLYNFEKLLDGNIEYLLADPTLIKCINPVKLTLAHDSVMDGYFEALDVDLRDAEYFIYIQKRIEYRDQFINGNRSAMNFVRLYTAQIEELNRDVVKPDFVKNRMAVTKWFRQPIDPKTTTVREYIKITQLMREEAEQRKNKPTDGEDN
jgi:hypothetical protein